MSTQQKGLGNTDDRLSQEALTEAQCEPVERANRTRETLHVSNPAGDRGGRGKRSHGGKSDRRGPARMTCVSGAQGIAGECGTPALAATSGESVAPVAERSQSASRQARAEAMGALPLAVTSAQGARVKMSRGTPLHREPWLSLQEPAAAYRVAPLPERSPGPPPRQQASTSAFPEAPVPWYPPDRALPLPPHRKKDPAKERRRRTERVVPHWPRLPSLEKAAASEMPKPSRLPWCNGRMSRKPRRPREEGATLLEVMVTAAAVLAGASGLTMWQGGDGVSLRSGAVVKHVASVAIEPVLSLTARGVPVRLILPRMRQPLQVASGANALTASDPWRELSHVASSDSASEVPHVVPRHELGEVVRALRQRDSHVSRNPAVRRHLGADAPRGLA